MSNPNVIDRWIKPDGSAADIGDHSESSAWDFAKLTQLFAAFRNQSVHQPAYIDDDLDAIAAITGYLTNDSDFEARATHKNYKDIAKFYNEVIAAIKKGGPVTTQAENFGADATKFKTERQRAMGLFDAAYWTLMPQEAKGDVPTVGTLTPREDGSGFFEKLDPTSRVFVELEVAILLPYAPLYDKATLIDPNNKYGVAHLIHRCFQTMCSQGGTLFNEYMHSILNDHVPPEALFDGLANMIADDTLDNGKLKNIIYSPDPNPLKIMFVGRDTLLYFARTITRSKVALAAPERRPAGGWPPRGGALTLTTGGGGGPAGGPGQGGTKLLQTGGGGGPAGGPGQGGTGKRPKPNY